MLMMKMQVNEKGRDNHMSMLGTIDKSSSILEAGWLSIYTYTELNQSSEENFDSY